MNKHRIKINFKGGLISPGELQIILQAAQKTGVQQVSFGLRQELWFEVAQNNLGIESCLGVLKENKIHFELDADENPNIISSYPAQDVFVQRNWLSESIYKDIFDSFTHKPRLKINIADNNQSFTPMLTGNINWIASAQQNCWYVNLRFPETNHIYTWSQWVDTSDIGQMSKAIEQLMLTREALFIGNPSENGDLLFELLQQEHHFNTIPATMALHLPTFMLPYYEGFNRYEDKLWLGIYRRDEQFQIPFLLELCQLCLATHIGLICSTSWKSIIVKNIDPQDRNRWDVLLAVHQINVRHAANELNFQIEDHTPAALALKMYLVHQLSQADTRTFGVCIGIKTAQVGEVFSSILIVRRVVRWAGVHWYTTYDILLAEEFNPNKRTAQIFAQGISKRKLAVCLKRAILKYYAEKAEWQLLPAQTATDSFMQAVQQSKQDNKIVLQCPNCLSIYDESIGSPSLHIPAGTSFLMLPSMYQCECCETPKSQFRAIEEVKLFA